MYLADSYYGDSSDAWLMSHPFSFEPGKKVQPFVYYKNQLSNTNLLNLTPGKDTLPASQTDIIWQHTVTNTSYIKAQINYTATKTGIKQIAFHCNTPVTYTYLYIDNFEEKNTAERVRDRNGKPVKRQAEEEVYD